MKTDRSNNKPAIATLIITALIIALVLIGALSKRVGFIGNAVGSIVTPVQSFASKASSSVAGFFGNIFNTTDKDKENARLRSELALNNQSLKDLEELKKENERLRALLNYTSALGNYKGVTARVIGRSSDVYFRVFTLNAGHNSGIDVNMPVVGSEGLVGLVTEVGANWCKVTAAIDSTMSVPIMIERTRDVCMARGVMNASNKSDRMELYYLPADRTDLIPGDMVITSGIGGVYPKGIRVGSISEVMTSAKSGVNALISPSTDFMHLEEVFVITGEGGED